VLTRQTTEGGISCLAKGWCHFCNTKKRPYFGHESKEENRLPAKVWGSTRVKLKTSKRRGELTMCWEGEKGNRGCKVGH